MTVWVGNAGHGVLDSGGTDPGALSPGGLKEMTVALNVTNRIINKIRSQGDTAYFVQDGDLDDVVAYEKSKNPPGVSDHYFFSVHCNAFQDRTVKGTEAYAYKPGGHGEQMAKAISSRMANALGTPNRGAKFANFYVLKNTNAPAVLVEIDFITNPDIAAKMSSEDYLELVAQTIFEGLYAGIGKDIKKAVCPTCGRPY